MDLARVFGTSLRTVDLLGRIGGEEFLVMAPETDLEGARALAERIRTNVESAQIFYKDERIEVTVSVGFSVADAGTTAEYDQSKHIAALALAEAKASGRNRS